MADPLRPSGPQIPGSLMGEIQSEVAVEATVELRAPEQPHHRDLHRFTGARHRRCRRLAVASDPCGTRSPS